MVTLTLIGIVKKNAIKMIDFVQEAHRRQEKPPAEAIREACLVHFAAIMMKTFAALMGALPIEGRSLVGLAVVSGHVVSQLLRLYITLVVYLWMEKLGAKVGGF